jgi:hypothetical protein
MSKRWLSISEEAAAVYEHITEADRTPGARTFTVVERAGRIHVTCYRLGRFSGSTPYEPLSATLRATVERLAREGWIMADAATVAFVAAHLGPVYTAEQISLRPGNNPSTVWDWTCPCGTLMGAYTTTRELPAAEILADPRCPKCRNAHKRMQRQR